MFALYYRHVLLYVYYTENSSKLKSVFNEFNNLSFISNLKNPLPLFNQTKYFYSLLNTFLNFKTNENPKEISVIQKNSGSRMKWNKGLNVNG